VAVAIVVLVIVCLDGAPAAQAVSQTPATKEGSQQQPAPEGTQNRAAPATFSIVAITTASAPEAARRVVRRQLPARLAQRSRLCARQPPQARRDTSVMAAFQTCDFSHHHVRLRNKTSRLLSEGISASAAIPISVVYRSVGLSVKQIEWKNGIRLGAEGAETMSARHWSGKIVCRECAAHMGGSNDHDSLLDLRRQLDHCRSMIDETLSRVFERPPASMIDDDDMYRFGPQGAD
jgi:hypothetical protein